MLWDHDHKLNDNDLAPTWGIGVFQKLRIFEIPPEKLQHFFRKNWLSKKMWGYVAFFLKIMPTKKSESWKFEVTHWFFFRSQKFWNTPWESLRFFNKNIKIPNKFGVPPKNFSCFLGNCGLTYSIFCWSAI